MALLYRRCRIYFLDVCSGAASLRFRSIAFLIILSFGIIMLLLITPVRITSLPQMTIFPLEGSAADVLHYPNHGSAQF
jgi:hypothetical protein